MPAYLGGKFDMAGAKWYGSNAENRKKGLPRSILMLTLNDKDTGAPVAHMSANILSAYRTGAIPGVGVKYLAHEDSKVCGIIGPGVMGKTALASFMAVRPTIETVKIKGRSQGSIDAFVKYVKEEFPTITSIEVVPDIESAVRDSDIVCIATSATPGNLDEYPYVKEEWIKPGAVICCPASAKFDEDFVLNRARNVTDCLSLYEAWAEEYPYPSYNTIPIPAVYCMDLIAEDKMKKDDLHDLGDILMGTVPARRNDEEITIYSVGGMPVEDIAWGTIVYRNAVEKGIGTKLNLWEEPDLA
jgi:ornithine cyclodeaminase